MERRDNYLIQANQAKARFLTFDQQKLIRKFGLKAEEGYLFVTMLARTYRICRETADIRYWDGVAWQDGNSYEEVMTLLDLLCDSREDRHPAGQWKNMQSFGLMFHRNLLENKRDSVAAVFDREPERFCRGCEALGGVAFPGADMAYEVVFFDDLKLLIQFWHGDEEFHPRLRYLWDENALMYLRYETMYFALSMLRQRLLEA